MTGAELTPEPPEAQSDRPLEDAGAEETRVQGLITPLVGASASGSFGDGRRIGPYRIIKRIGEGGMGTVYLADQTEPVVRQVALKVCKAGQDSEAVLRRFDNERRALALMNHDAIARVFDAASNAAGQPYFVMEYIEGLEINRYSDQLQLSVEERLRLFCQVCAGVQHAHQKGVIHRDIKPGNILVTRQGDRHVPKIIDFGLVRAIQRGSTDDNPVTEHGMIFGTPEFMSPEQACGDPDEVDTRSDIYSLGVVLYHLMSGELPFSSEKLRKAGPAGGLRILQIEEPSKPSTRASTRSEKSSEHAACRQTNARGLYRKLKGDLDWIIMKAIEKEPARRYSSAHALAADIERYFRREPVLAGPPGAMYRVRKFVRRYATQVAAAALVVVSLVIGIIAASWQATVARERADALAKSQKEFRQLAASTLLDRALEQYQELQPAWPGKIEEMKSWLAESRAAILSVKESLRGTVLELEDRAVEITPAQAQADRKGHPRFAEYAATRGRTELFARIQARLANPTPVDLPAFPKDLEGRSPAQLNKIARPLVLLSEERREWSKEAYALVIAKRAVELAAPPERVPILDTLARAYLNNGMEEAALATSRKVIEAADSDLELYEKGYRFIANTIASLSGTAGQATVAKLRDEERKLAAIVSTRRTWSFADPADAYLHRTLKQVLEDVESFEKLEYHRVAERLAWAKRIDTLSQDHPDASVTWGAATSAIRRADGITASRLYANHPIDLKPQVGLVPIGMNPATRLWEFYHLRSAAQRNPTDDDSPLSAPLRIPKHDPETGIIEVGEHTGIVFVLVPGGTAVIGEQNADSEGRNYYANAAAQSPVHEVPLDPFFLARHELTQGQWQRLSLFETRCSYAPGYQREGMKFEVTLAHPVETVSPMQGIETAQLHGLTLPTEVQWEYACRAGTDTPWWTGPDRESLRRKGGVVNLIDQAVRDANVPWLNQNDWPELNDGWLIHAPVDRMRPNPWGMHSMHGNVREFCLDIRGKYDQPTRPGDGLRIVGDPRKTSRIMRGSSFVRGSNQSRAGYRAQSSPQMKVQDRGLRFARKVL